MCVIAFSPKGVEAPTEEQIKSMFSTNPDGAGYAYNDKKGKVVYHKGFMSVEELIKELSPLDQWTDTNLAIHFRIGTAGKNDAHTCHPFKIATSFGELRKLHNTDAKSVLFHNGIIDKGGQLDPLSSDTQDFVSAFAPMLEKYSKSKNRDHAIAEYTTGNRLLVLYEENKYKLWGDWTTLSSGLMVSNTHWQPKSYATYSYPQFNWSAWYDEREEELETKTDKKIIAEASWKMLEAEGYDWYANEAELQAVLDDADSKHGCMITKNGHEYYVDKQKLEIWEIEGIK